MSKKTKKIEAELAELTIELHDKDLKKKARKKIEARAEELRAVLAKLEPAKKVDGKKPKAEKVAPDASEAIRRAKAAAKVTVDEVVLEAVNTTALDEEVVRVAEVIKAKRDGVDRSDAAAVKAYNETEGKASGNFITSDEERAREAARLEGAEPAKKAKGKKSKAEENREISDELKAKVKKNIEAGMSPSEAVRVQPVEKSAEGVFVAGEGAPEPEILDPEVLPVDPITGEVFDPEMMVPTNGAGRPLIWSPEKEKLVPYSRMTTFIDVLEDKSAISDWKVRSALVGALGSEESGEISEEVRAAADEYAAELEKIAALDEAGDLFAGELAMRTDAAEKAFKSTMRGLGERALVAGGTKIKASRGTYLHGLTEIYDTKGGDALRAVEGITKADLLDVSAYVAAMEALGIEVIEAERRVVLDEHGVTGTFDRGVYYKPEGATRRKKVIADIKTGRIDYGIGKIAMQIAGYALGSGYNAETHEREKLGYSKDLGLLIHLPAGSGVCTVYELDLTKGVEGLKHAVTVKAWRASTTEAQAYRGAKAFVAKVATVDKSEVKK